MATPPTGTSRLESWLETWHGLSRTKQIVIAVVVVLVVLALGALVPSEGDDEPSTSPAPPVSTESDSGGEDEPSGAGNASPQVASWAGDVVDWSEQQPDAFSDLAALLRDDSFNTRLLLGDQDAVIGAAIPLAVMRQCTNRVSKSTRAARLGRSPVRSAGLAQSLRVRPTVLEGCRQFQHGVDRVRGSRMTRGTEILRQATAEIDELQTGGG